MEKNSLLNPNLIIYNSTETNVEGIFREAYERLREEGFVHTGYLEALLEREEKHPTALELGTLNVAIPHTDPKYVIDSCIFVASLSSPVKFKSMVDNCDIEVSYVFFLVLEEGERHIEALSQLIRVLQVKDNVEALEKCSSLRDIFLTLNLLMNEYNGYKYISS